MHSSRFLIALGFTAFAVTAQAQTTEAPAPETAADPDAKVTGQTVVAIVNGEDITIGDIVALRTELPPQYQSIPDRQLYDGLINQMVNQILLSQAATRAASTHDKYRAARSALEVTHVWPAHPGVPLRHAAAVVIWGRHHAEGEE